MCIVEHSREIYRHLADEQSRMIYTNRLNYSLTGDMSFIEDLVNRTLRKNQTWKSFCESLKVKSGSNEMVIFVALIWGNILYQETKDFIPWKGVIDSNPKDKCVGRLPVVSFEDFSREYGREVVVLSSFKNGGEMFGQLKDVDIPDSNIMDAGSVIYGLTEKAIYFDLEECITKGKREFFIDAGGFDGLTTASFMEWCGGNGYSYIFEPDERNRMSIINNLREISNYEIVPKALWSRTATLAMDSKGNFASNVREKTGERQEEIIDSIAIDDFAKGRRITYIKMDIEGAEAEALRGAARVIEEQKPRLAISIYHREKDIWEIPALILNYCPEYQFYLRHYSFSWYDTVLYAVAEADGISSLTICGKLSDADDRNVLERKIILE